MDCARPQLDAIKRGTANQDGLSKCAWERIFHATSWFRQFDSRGVIENWLNGQATDLATDYLCLHQGSWPDEVAAYLEPFTNRGDDWPRRLQTIMLHWHSCRSRRYLDLFLRLLDEGMFDTADGQLLQLPMLQFGAGRSEWVPEVLAGLLRLLGRQMQRDAVTNPTTDVGRQGRLARSDVSEAVHKAAKGHPRTFVSPCIARGTRGRRGNTQERKQAADARCRVAVSDRGCRLLCGHLPCSTDGGARQPSSHWRRLAWTDRDARKQGRRTLPTTCCSLIYCRGRKPLC